MQKPHIMTSIKFGTDGWRAIIGEDFIPSNIEKVIQAFSDLFKNPSPLRGEGARRAGEGGGERGIKVIVGFDRRNQSPESAKLAAEVLAGNGFTVLLSDQYCPTPCISWMVKTSDAFAGIIITASHNPSNWNGIKFKESYGGSAAPEYTNQVEAQILANEQSGREIQKMDLEKAKAAGLVQMFSPLKDYVNQMKSLLDLKAIEKAGVKILNDPLFGAGTGFMQHVVPTKVDAIHTAADTSFGGLNPEPIDKNLGELIGKMKTGQWDIGLATDGDADRIGAIDEKGNFVGSQQIFALLLKHYVENKKLKGAVVKSVSTTQMINRLCDKFGLPCFETPIGFRHISKLLVQHNALMGGEESGGISFEPHVHERDGILNGLFLVELMSIKGKKLSELVLELSQEVGQFYFDRLDLHCERQQIENYNKRLSESSLKEIAGMKIISVNTADGFKYTFEDSSWLLIRSSGTEPLVRVYAESGNKEKVIDLLNFGKLLVEGPS